MVNLTDNEGFTRPLWGGLWNNGNEAVVVFATVEEAMVETDRYLKIWHTVPLDANPSGFSWERFSETGPMESALIAVGRFSRQNTSGHWTAAIFKLGGISK